MDFNAASIVTIQENRILDNNDQHYHDFPSMTVKIDDHASDFETSGDEADERRHISPSPNTRNLLRAESQSQWSTKQTLATYEAMESELRRLAVEQARKSYDPPPTATQLLSKSSSELIRQSSDPISNLNSGDNIMNTINNNTIIATTTSTVPNNLLLPSEPQNQLFVYPQPQLYNHLLTQLESLEMSDNNDERKKLWKLMTKIINEQDEENKKELIDELEHNNSDLKEQKFASKVISQTNNEMVKLVYDNLKGTKDELKLIKKELALEKKKNEKLREKLQNKKQQLRVIEEKQGLLTPSLNIDEIEPILSSDVVDNDDNNPHHKKKRTTKLSSKRRLSVSSNESDIRDQINTGFCFKIKSFLNTNGK